MSLTAKSALVTGAANRLGAEIARTLHENGANLIIHYRSSKLVLDDDNRLVGLLFAGSDTTTIINRIEHVFSTLGVAL